MANDTKDPPSSRSKETNVRKDRRPRGGAIDDRDHPTDPAGRRLPRPDRLPGERPSGRWNDRPRHGRPRAGAVRPLGAADAAAYVAHLRRLDPESRRRRFSRPVDDRFLERFVAAIDWARALVLGYVEDGKVRGVVQLAWPDVAWLKGAAELAIQVEAGWRRLGIGTALLASARRRAREGGLPGIVFFAQADNEPMLRLARKLGAPLKHHGGEVEGALGLGSDDRATGIFGKPGAAAA